MRVTETTWNNDEGPDREITIKIMARRSLLKRLRRLAKSADGDHNIPAFGKWIGKICGAVIGLSAVYFVARLILN